MSGPAIFYNTLFDLFVVKSLWQEKGHPNSPAEVIVESETRGGIGHCEEDLCFIEFDQEISQFSEFDSPPFWTSFSTLHRPESRRSSVRLESIGCILIRRPAHCQIQDTRER